MKKILAPFVLLFVSCSSDIEAPNIDGVYKCVTSVPTIELEIQEENCHTISIIRNDTLRWGSVITTGKYPTYEYKADGLTITAEFSGNSISATLDGVLIYKNEDGPNIDSRVYPFDQAAFIFRKK